MAVGLVPELDVRAWRLGITKGWSSVRVVVGVTGWPTDVEGRGTEPDCSVFSCKASGPGAAIGAHELPSGGVDTDSFDSDLSFCVTGVAVGNGVTGTTEPFESVTCFPPDVKPGSA